MVIKNSKYRNSETSQFRKLPGRGLSPRHGHGGHLLEFLTTYGLTAQNCEIYPPKGDNAGLVKTALVNTGRTFF